MIVVAAAGPVACLAAAFIGGAYCYAVAIGIRNGLLGEPRRAAADDD